MYSIALPWCFVREVPVDIELVSEAPLSERQPCLKICYQPSAKVAIIRFKRGMQQGLLGRVSRSSIMEYHAFGIIS